MLNPLSLRPERPSLEGKRDMGFDGGVQHRNAAAVRSSPTGGLLEKWWEGGRRRGRIGEPP